MTIRRAKWADLHDVLEIERAVFGRESYSSTTFLADVLRDWKGFFVSETEEGEIAGYVLARVAFGLFAWRRGGITSIAVAKPHQRTGIGRQLLLYALEYVRGRGAREVDLEVAITNRPAQYLYEGLGFVRDRTLLHYYGLDKHGVRMVCELRKTAAAGGCEAESEARFAGKANPARHE